MSNDETMLPVPVIILEDEPIIQNRLRRILTELGYENETLHFVSNLKEAFEKIEEIPVSLALVDLGLPDGNGVEFIEKLRERDSSASILVISAWSTQSSLFSAIKAGATGYVLKERDDSEVLLAIRSILRGGAPIDPFIAQKILQKLHLDESSSQVMSTESTKKQESTEVLSKREQEILILVSQGLSNKEIAEQLNLSRYTIESHVKHIYRKLSVSTRIMAVDVGRNLGILD